MFNTSTMDYVAFKFGQTENPDCQSENYVGKGQDPVHGVMIRSDCEACAFGRGAFNLNQALTSDARCDLQYDCIDLVRNRE